MIPIGIAGPAGSGKTTVAEMIRLVVPDTAIVPFAKPLKDYARRLGWNGEKDERGRRLLQLLGTDCGRMCISENLWVDKWEKCVDADFRWCRAVIADDVRFDNEAEKITARGGFVVRLTGRQDHTLSAEHPSERGLTVPCRAVIDNSSTLADLSQSVFQVLREQGLVQ